GERPAGGGFWWDFALALGYSALAMMAVQFWLTARFKHASAPFGVDILYYFHRYLALVAFGVIVLHAGVLLWRYRPTLGGFDPRTMPGYMLAGWIALSGFALLLASSLWRKPLRIEYDRWRRLHVLVAVAAMVAAVWHIQGSAYYLADPGKHALWTVLALSWIGLLLYVRLWRPWRLRRQPWTVESVTRERGRSWTLRLRPQSGAVFDYAAGQFAWLTLRASPWSLREHPFSFASAPTRNGHVEFTVKELGDFTSRIGEIQPGDTAFVDGPYGSFGIEHTPDARGAVFLAGGVGIAPIISQLRTLADRGDARPLWLFYGNRSWDRVVFREEIDALATRLDLTVVHVLSEPPADWTGERGFITPDVLARHLPTDSTGLHAFVCGPTPMIRLVERGLGALGMPLARVHSEIFDLA
ncbi:MAG TPA: ferredoxin reductase family protein, partial [Arenimonas sp.]|nr:ferredoxin reductase family protein [Arenimonas sp.]